MGRKKSWPDGAGPWSVSFKHEDEDSGMAIGPVTVVDHSLYDAWAKVHATGLGIPFGSKPPGLHNLGWNTLADARRVAAHYGVTLKER